MRKTVLISALTLTAVMVFNSSVWAKTGTSKIIGKSVQVKKYVISGNSANCEDSLKEALSNLKIEIENGKLGECPTIIYPGMNKPGNDSSGTNKPTESEAVTNKPGNDNVETGKPTNKPEVETTTAGIPETEKPTTNIPETSKPVVEETTVEVTSKPVENNQDKSYAEQVVDLVNQERVKAGLKKVTLDKNIEAAALIRAKEIEVSFSHTRPNGSSFSTVLKENGIGYRGAGENIAWGQTSPEAVMNAWMNSEGHRANILNASFTKIGVGYYQNSAGRKYWVQLFVY